MVVGSLIALRDLRGRGLAAAGPPACAPPDAAGSGVTLVACEPALAAATGRLPAGALISLARSCALSLTGLGTG